MDSSFAPDPSGAAAPALLCSRVGRSFPGVDALTDVSMTVQAGTVHALLGENGAGKSTLIKIVTGALAPSSGSVAIAGKKLTQFTPRAAQDLGVRVIHQERLVAPDLSVGTNILLDSLPRNRCGFLTSRSVDREAQRKIDRLGIELDATMPAALASPAQQQLIELVRAIHHDTKVLIMDEPTVSLHRSEVEVLFRVIRTATDQGAAVVYISHHLHEVFEIARTATILRNGRRIRDVTLAETSRDGLVEAMFGRRPQQLRVDRTNPPATDLMELREVSLHPGATPINLTVQGGRVLALLGEAGSGATELANLIAGRTAPTTGTITLGGAPAPVNRRDATRRGVGYVPADRKTAGLLLGLSISENLYLGRGGNAQARWFSFPRRFHRAAASELAVRQIRVSDPRKAVRLLSGGNQQRVIFARWALAECDLLVLDQPTAGVDVNAKFEIYREIVELTARGAAVVIVTGDYEEVTGVADRVVVMRDGGAVADVDADGLSPEDLYSIGIDGEGAAA